MEKTKYEKLAKYLSTNQFKVVDTIGVPHFYCITPEHLLSNEMYLNIEEAEKRGARCDTCKKRKRKFGERVLAYNEHKQALLIEVSDSRKLNDIPELKDYLLSIKSLAESDGFIGFAFIQAKMGAIQ